ncbi:type VII secretion integral membrane protein EccD [Jatrophihabitans sp. GAS493]|uniref:EsaB/YukD family protein n=1 Tax=Jatrophihabitans sp. GAS493 TaxID=1907575 RepID=UPI000BC02E64|nr:EsaB/YukD family protein [Jatrophihabitans sp. GAS493]SOD70523.1 type VII secretion integral membrane protein EccD [Jatrophihabitans sp. GAS493]
MLTWSRVTVRSQARRANVAIPADEPIDAFLPQLAELLDETTASPEETPMDGVRRLVLTTSLGHRLDSESTLSSSQVSDGDLLYLIAEQKAPPVPTVWDVSEAVGLDRLERTDLWSAAHAARAVVLLTGVAAAGLAFQVTLRASLVTTGAVGFAALIAWGLVPIATRRGQPVSASALALVGGIFAIAAVIALDLWHRAGWPAELGAAGLAATLSGCVVSALLKFGRVPLFGGLLASTLCGGWLAACLSGLGYARASALLVCASALLLPFLPGWAMHLTGLHRLDDRRRAGAGAPADDEAALFTSLGEAHALLAVFVLLCSAAMLAGGISLVVWGRPWALVLVAATGASAALRARMFPSAIEVAALIGVAVSAAASLLVAWALRNAAPPLVPSLASTTVLFATLGCSLWSPTPQSRARIRLVCDRLERLAPLALLPAAVGVFDLYARLLKVF